MLSLDRVLREHVAPRAEELRSARDLEREPAWRELRRAVETALGAVEHHAVGASPAPRPFYRIVAWNIQRGLAFEGVLRHLREHPVLARADVVLLTETDKGMARSGNRHVARELAEGLTMHSAFVPCYLNLTKGVGRERLAAGENALGLHGNAILSRYPLSRFGVHSLPNGKDKMACPEKRLGQERALTARVDLPGLPLSVTCVHLDAHASRRHRVGQMRLILAETSEIESPVILGGDWNTTTYDAQSVAAAFLSLLRRQTSDVEHAIRREYLHPERRFERRLFETLREAGFDWEGCNRMGVATWHYESRRDGADDGTGGWLPGWAPRVIGRALRHRGGHCPFKLDWFATRGAACADPFVVPSLRHCGRRVSDHDPIGVDVLPR